MRATIAMSILAAVSVSLSGCLMLPPPPVKGKNTEIQSNTVQAGDLSETITVDRRVLKCGDTLHVTLLTRNTGLEPIPVEAESTAPMIVTVWRYQPGEWVRVQDYPKSVIRQRQVRILLPNQQETFEMDVPSEMCWPSSELLKVTAELNGRPEARPFVFVEMK